MAAPGKDVAHHIAWRSLKCVPRDRVETTAGSAQSRSRPGTSAVETRNANGSGEERVRALFTPDARRGTMAGVHDRFVRQRTDAVERALELGAIGEREI